MDEVRDSPVSRLFSTTFARLTAAPDWSVIVPERRAETCAELESTNRPETINIVAKKETVSLVVEAENADLAGGRHRKRATQRIRFSPQTLTGKGGEKCILQMDV